VSNRPGAPAESRDVLPRAFGRYVLFDRIGRGGMADIFLARAETELGASRRVVVKQILPALSGDEAFSRMLVAEAKLAAQLHHGNIVQVFDLGREEGRLYIAMEYVEGFDLHQLLRRLSSQKIPLPPEFAIFVVRETLRALDYAHRARDAAGRPMGLVHRDVSPSNVLVSFEGEVKLCDFGIARALAAGSEIDEGAVSRSRVAGKSAYMSPEHARGEALDARADVFAAAIVLWELCAGRRMYKGTEDEMLALARAGAAPELPSRGLPDEPALRAVLARGLAADRDARFASAKDMLAALEDWAHGARLMASQLRFGAFLTEHFEAELVQVRREREAAAARDLAAARPVPAPEVAPEITPAPSGLTPLPGEASEIRRARAVGPSSRPSATDASAEEAMSRPIDRRGDLPAPLRDDDVDPVHEARTDPPPPMRPRVAEPVPTNAVPHAPIPVAPVAGAPGRLVFYVLVFCGLAIAGLAVWALLR
jgi:serine/threonine-protein kinase